MHQGPQDSMGADAPPAKVLLVGTGATVMQLHAALAAHRPAPQVLGCVLPGDGAARVGVAGAESAKPRLVVCADTGAARCSGGQPQPPDAASDPLPPVLGDFAGLSEVLARQPVDLVLVSLPMAMADQARRVIEALGHCQVAWRWMPTLADQLAGRLGAVWGSGQVAVATGASGSGAWAVDPVQLLGRHPRPLDEASIRRTITGRTVLITGAGGSIGSELARMVCRFDPCKLVLVERAENALFEIDRSIAALFPRQERSAVLHDVTDAARTLGVITAFTPDTIFHAAAHKHVPMMEDHPAAALENNFYGTRSIADAAAKAGVGRFVMISTDKAVNPSSVMGASKRLAELYIQHLSQRSDTVFCMVRFGNVLGSACSVLPIWTEQLSRGGSLTVTHPQMTRYFMTIPEAAGLVVQSAALAGGGDGVERGALSVEREGHAGTDTLRSTLHAPRSTLHAPRSTPHAPRASGGEVFLLDMGQPIRILDLARRFIRWHGLEPDVDVKIDFTGVRPGEKLFEELAYDSEDMIPTPHPSVRLWRTAPPDGRRMREIIATLDRLRGNSDGKSRHLWQGATREELLGVLHWAVPEMVKPASAPAAVAPAASGAAGCG